MPDPTPDEAAAPQVSLDDLAAANYDYDPGSAGTPFRCTCDYAGMPGENHKPQCEIEGGPHAECALRIHELEAERDSLRAEVERAQSGATSWRDMAWSLTKATEKRDAAVRALHQELDALHNHDEDGNCFACDRPWPCPTVKALNRAALVPVETPQEETRA